MKRFFTSVNLYFNPLGEVSLKQKAQRLVIGFLVGMPILAWALVLGIKGPFGPLGWWLLIVFGMVGLLSAFLSLFGLVYKAFHKKRLSKTQTALVLWSLFVAWPASWLFGLNQMPYPANAEQVIPSAVIELPFTGQAMTLWGGETLRNNKHVWLPVERWAYDFILPAKKEGSTNLKDYPIFGKDVVSPVKGTVIGVYDKEADQQPSNKHTSSPKGNYIYIQMSDTGTYIVLEHLKQGSAMVVKGENVEVGTMLAKIGNSGNSDLPHLHIHHQKENPLTYPSWLSEGLPLYFYTKEELSMPIGGVDHIDGKSIYKGDFVTSRIED